MATVTFDKATRIYPGSTVPAVDKLELSIADGEFLVLVGPSGCGKSTSLRMLAGLEEVNAGSIFIGDRDVTDVAPKDRDIAMVFQNYALYPHMSVYQNMAYGLKIRKLVKEEIDLRVRKAARILELEKLLDRLPRQLSGGQRQRVAMGRAIVREPAVFLFDEPLSNLDAKLRVQMRLEIKRLQRELGVTSIYVTHDQVEAMTLADRLIVMNAGVADQIGTPMDVYDRPASMFVAGFIGSPAMNFTAARVGADRTSVELTASSTRIVMPLGRQTSAKAGDLVTLGVRPEHLQPFQNGPVEFEIEMAEPLGADFHIGTPPICDSNLDRKSVV